jgi:hypothetical protein
MPILGIDLDVLTPAERRDLANSLLRAAWSATLPRRAYFSSTCSSRSMTP